MANRIHVLDDFGGALFWGESALVCDADERDERAEAPSSEVPTARSAPVPPLELELELEESGEHPCAVPAADFAEARDDGPTSIPIELDEEPCPETLRSPVSDGISPSVRRPRVA